jgi:glutamate transport system substrate-binding protein
MKKALYSKLLAAVVIGAAALLPTTALAQAPSFADGTSMKAFQERGNILVGIRMDLPGVAQLNPLTNELEGFDADIIRAIGVRLGLDVEDVRFKEIPSTGREAAVNEGLIDFLIGSYVITEKRREQVSQAGPYAMAKGYVYVREENRDKYQTLADLKGATVCTTPTSTFVGLIEENGATFVPFEDISACTQQVVNGNVDGKTGNDLNNLGYVKQYPELVPAAIPAFKEEGWGVAFKKDDTELCNFVIGALRDIVATGEWKELWTKHFIPLGVAEQTDPVIQDRC